jgi:integrase/recombinase XerD
MINVSTTIILDTRRALKDGTYPVKLRLTYQREQRYYSLNISLSKEDFARTQGEKPRGEFKSLQLKFNGVEQHARAVIDKMKTFTFDAFEKKFLGSSIKNEVFAAYDEAIAQYTSDGQISTASNYSCSQKSLIKFNKGKKLPFTTITPEYLKKYESWMLGEGNSRTTVGIYLRPLKALFNKSINAGDVNKESYPFGKGGYLIPAGQNIKKALTLDEIGKIFRYEPATEAEAKARDLWIFSYICNGMNMKDIALLKYKDLDNDKITFYRAKTAYTNRQRLIPIVAILDIHAKQIIERWGNKPTFQDSCIFPILTAGLTLKQEKDKIAQAVKTTNKYIKRIAQAIGIEHNVTTYYARHSFATILMQSGASIEYISKELGHSSTQVTGSYLGSFENSIKKDFIAKLTAFGEKLSE